ncbi:MAG: hypothetical protein KBC69_04405 [Candidatus Magasanikbacteria bacterium]|nr:hypothetical protein [Candidatus Magasanikbacteria bacterium]
MSYRAFLVLFVFLALISNGCSPVEEPSLPDAGELAAPDRCQDPNVRNFILSGYEAEIENSQLSPVLQAWLKDQQGSYALAYIHARCRNQDAEIKVLVTYYGGTGRRDAFFQDGWTPEKEEAFRSLLERYVEAVYPGYNFTVVFNKAGQGVTLTGEDADIIVSVGYNGLASYATGKTIFLIHPTIIGHEAGHLCPNPEDGNGWCTAFSHHYCGDNYLDHSCGPPESDEGECIMLRTGNEFGQTELWMLRRQYPENANQEIANLGAQIIAMLPAETNLHQDAPDLGYLPPPLAALFRAMLVL